MPDSNGARNESFFRRVLPNTALSLAALVFFMGIASAFTGAVLYAYYEARQQRTENEVEAFFADFADEVEGAKGQIRTEGETALAEIRAQLDELEQFAASGQTLQSLVDQVAPSVWFVSTQDEAGAPSAGSAFVVFADPDQSFLLASYTTVRAATVDPGPSVIVSKGGEEYEATLFSWDPALDLALLAIPKPSLPALPWAPEDPAVRLGDRVLAVSGFGGDGAAVTQGFVAAVSAEGIQHDAPVGAAYQGGPLVNTNGEVVAVASRAYSPSGFDPLAVFLAPPVRRACDAVVQCPSGAPEQPAG